MFTILKTNRELFSLCMKNEFGDNGPESSEINEKQSESLDPVLTDLQRTEEQSQELEQSLLNKSAEKSKITNETSSSLRIEKMKNSLPTLEGYTFREENGRVFISSVDNKHSAYFTINNKENSTINTTEDITNWSTKFRSKWEGKKIDNVTKPVKVEKKQDNDGQSFSDKMNSGYDSAKETVEATYEDVTEWLDETFTGNKDLQSFKGANGEEVIVEYNSDKHTLSIDTEWFDGVEDYNLDIDTKKITTKADAEKYLKGKISGIKEEYNKKVAESGGMRGTAETTYNDVSESVKTTYNDTAEKLKPTYDKVKESVESTYDDVDTWLDETFTGAEDLQSFKGGNGEDIDVEYNAEKHILSIDTGFGDGVSDYPVEVDTKLITTRADAKKYLKGKVDDLRSEYDNKVKIEAFGDKADKAKFINGEIVLFEDGKLTIADEQSPTIITGVPKGKEEEVISAYKGSFTSFLDFSKSHTYEDFMS